MREYLLLPVTLDDENIFTAYVAKGEDWNGFALPYFTLTEGKRVCEYVNSRRKDDWVVINQTDEVVAAENLTKETALKFVEAFPLRYKEQGYYLKSNGERIKPEDVKLEIKPSGESFYDAATDIFYIEEQIEDEEYEQTEYPGVDIMVGGNSIHVYPIGTGSWIWSVATQLN